MPIPHYLRRASVGLFFAGLIFVVLPPVLRILDPTAGSFGIELLNALGLAAMLFSAVLHMALFAYEKFLAPFYTYQAESLDGQGKLFENLTDELRVPLYTEDNIYPARLAQLVERRKTNQFIFLVRCVRLSFCLLSLAFLLHLAMQVISVAMTAVPASAPALSQKLESSSASGSADSIVVKRLKPSSERPVAASAMLTAPGPLSSNSAALDSWFPDSAVRPRGLTLPTPSGAMGSSWPAEPYLSPVIYWASPGGAPLSATSKCSSSGALAPVAAQ